MNLDGFASQFERVIGQGAVESLVASFTSTPVILLAGDQASGKSTAAKLIAEHLGGAVGSTGALVRARAIEEGVTFEEFNARMRDDPDADVRNDYLAASAIAAGQVVVFESRLAGHLGAWLRALGRSALVSAYLHCPARERALRVLERLTSADVPARIDETLVTERGASFETVLGALTKGRGERLRPALAALVVASQRDEADRRRIERVYGIDYSDSSVFDARFGTGMTSPIDTARAVLSAARDAVVGSLPRTEFCPER